MARHAAACVWSEGSVPCVRSRRADLLCDASRNSNMAYHDVVRLRLCNNTRAHAAGDNPLDGAKKADRYMS